VQTVVLLIRYIHNIFWMLILFLYGSNLCSTQTCFFLQVNLFSDHATQSKRFIVTFPLRSVHRSYDSFCACSLEVIIWRLSEWVLHYYCNYLRLRLLSVCYETCLTNQKGNCTHWALNFRCRYLINPLNIHNTFLGILYWGCHGWNQESSKIQLKSQTIIGQVLFSHLRLSFFIQLLLWSDVWSLWWLWWEPRQWLH